MGSFLSNYEWLHKQAVEQKDRARMIKLLALQAEANALAQLFEFALITYGDEGYTLPDKRGVVTRKRSTRKKKTKGKSP